MVALAFCWILCLPSLADDPSPKVWAQSLASPNSDERFATIDAIEALGMKALPTLREIAVTATPEVRAMTSDLIGRIGSNRLLRPSLITFGPDAKNVSDAVVALRNQSGFQVDLLPEDEARWKGRAVTIAGDVPLGFFEALDRLGASGGLRHDPTGGFTYPPKGGIRVRMVPFDGPSPPTAYAGPYRVVLTVFSRLRTSKLTKKPADSRVREQFTGTLEVEAEPGILIDRAGPVRILEATDDKGRDLRSPTPAESVLPSNMRSWGQETIGTFTCSFPLQIPEDRGARITRLKGVIPTTALTRTDELFAAPLDKIEGKTFTSGGITVRINRVNLTGTSGTLEISVKGEQGPEAQSFAPGPRQASLASLRIPFNPDDHLRIEDSDGNPYSTSSNATTPMGPDGMISYRVSLYPNRPVKAPAKLRYFSVASVATEIPFDFRDLPIP